MEDIEKNFKSVEKGSDGGSTMYSGELTSEGVTKLLGPAGRFGRGGGGGGGNAPAPETTGRATVTVNGDGQIVKIVVEATIKAQIRGNQVEIKVKRTIEVSNHGKADFEIPEEAKKILGG